uniref:Uncharacterized protein n=1 Tax=Grammatophora oceanica TaxID=210454 RepID=A0A7S1VIQ0_9STRA
MSIGHKERKDEQSCLIAAEAANGKFGGFASTFLFYAQILSQFPNRSEEARDAARMCLRMPLPSIGMTKAQFKKVAVLGQLAEDGDNDEAAMAKLQVFYERIRQQENDEKSTATSAAEVKSPEQEAIDDANVLLDRMALKGDESKWEEVRSEVAAVYRKVGRTDMANFVDPNGASNDLSMQ